MSEDQRPLIAVVGATSKQGRSVATTLLESNQYRVRALTRNRDSAEARALADLGAEIVAAPLGYGHQKDLVAAFQNADGAYLMTPQLEPQDNAEFMLGKKLADAAVEAGVGHIVFSTLDNVDKITGKPPMRRNTEFFEKQRMQAAVAERHARGQHLDRPGKEGLGPHDPAQLSQALAHIALLVGKAVNQQRRPNGGNIVTASIRSNQAAHIGD